MKISVIIPIYNCEKYIARCIESVLKQKYSNFELILIDDGSLDNSYNICNNYKNKDERIILYKQENHGVSFTRNMGITKATGDYIMFLDADDYIEEITLEKCVKFIEDYNADIVKFNFIKEFSKTSIKNKNLVERDILLKKPYKEIIENIFDNDNYCSSCECMIRTEIAKTSKFNEEILVGEDFMYFIDVLTKSQNIYISNENLYHYVVNQNSVTNTFNYQKYLKYIYGLFVVVGKISDNIYKNLNISVNPKAKLERNIRDYFYASYQMESNEGIKKLYDFIYEDKKLLQNFNKYELQLDDIAKISFKKKIILKLKKYIKKML